MAEEETIEPTLPYAGARRFLEFLGKASGSPFTAVAALRGLLLASAFVEIREDDPWLLVPGGKYFFTRNSSSIVAFAIGSNYELGQGFTIVGAHTDSPALKLKPISASEASGCQTVCCETYGGGIWQTWFDRDLGLCGIVLIRDKRSNKLTSRVVSLKTPLMRISTIAPHLDSRYTEGFTVNKETDLRALLAVSASASRAIAEAPPKLNPHMLRKGGKPKHHILLLKAVANELGCDLEAIEGLDLRLCDAQPPITSGVLGEFVSGQGIDDLNGAYCAVAALIASSADLSKEHNVRLAFLFDHEEVGSSSPQGAASPIVEQTLERVMRGVIAGTGLVETGDLPNAPGFLSEMLFIAKRKSMLLSVDNAHAVHHNFPGKHEGQHGPELNAGPVIKYNSNLRYATEVVGATFLRSVAIARNIPVQEFIPRQDMPCGTTIGPIVSGGTAIRAVDIGNAQLSMHSIREVCGAADIDHMVSLIGGFYEEFSTANLPI
jgi:aspartyl aminopeptidase